MIVVQCEKSAKVIFTVFMFSQIIEKRENMHSAQNVNIHRTSSLKLKHLSIMHKIDPKRQTEGSKQWC